MFRRIAVHTILEAVAAALQTLPDSTRKAINGEIDRVIARFTGYLNEAAHRVPKLWRQDAQNEVIRLKSYLEAKLAEALDVPPPDDEDG